ncbi:histidine phosphatase family protein [Haladaptatus sp. W1]|uniref:histidine phosphatase family protein n=1 Tax=Haladaptatus sp. W1 TaxID=1897478 RepID=UPI0020C7E32D|nr:histidine phosphatase family protein [Haladaptatus sp. W1]
MVGLDVFVSDGESNEEAQTRGLAAVGRTVDRHTGESVVVGTHGNLLTLVLNAYDDRFDVDFWRDELTTPDVYEVEFADESRSDPVGITGLYE